MACNCRKRNDTVAVNPLDIKRIIFRIESLQRTSTHDWMGGDDLEFRNSLPGGRDPRALPEPKWLGDQAPVDIPQAKWQTWIQTCLRLESLVSRNRPGNPRRMMHDIARGKIPLHR